LKGRSVEHGADQVLATAELWTSKEHRCDRICGLIVARQYPKAATAIQVRLDRFAKRYAGPLHVVTKNDEFHLENLLSFKGPYRR
jgi:hypothetical protein